MLLHAKPMSGTMAGNSQEANTWYNRGRYFSDAGAYDQAALCFGRALEYNPGDARAWRRRGFALLKLQRYEESEACYDRALEIDPEDAVSWQRKGFLCAKLHRPEEALACSDRSLRLNPASVTALHTRGWVFVAERRYDEAVECYDRILEIDPDRDFARRNREQILAHKAFRKLAADVSEAEKVVEIPPFICEILRTRDYGGIDRAYEALSELLADKKTCACAQSAMLR